MSKRTGTETKGGETKGGETKGGETHECRNTRVAKHKGGETTGVETKGGETHECRNPNGAELFYQLPDAKSLFSCWSNPLDCNRDFSRYEFDQSRFQKMVREPHLLRVTPRSLRAASIWVIWIRFGSMRAEMRPSLKLAVACSTPSNRATIS